MNQAAFTIIFHWVAAHGYLFMLGLMMIEGPTITTAAAFAASWGYFNPFLVYGLSIIGDVLPDIAYYYVGYAAQFILEKGLRGRWRLPLSWQTKIEKFLARDTVETVVFIKLTPFLPFAGLAFLGSRRVNAWKVFVTCAWITAIKDLIFVLIGYYLGKLFSLEVYLKYGNWIVPALLVIFIVLYFAYRSVFALLSKKLDRV